MPLVNKRKNQLATLACSKNAAKVRMYREVKLEQTKRNIQEEDEEMSIGSSVNCTGTYDAVADHQDLSIDTTVQQQQQQPRMLSAWHSG